MVFKHQTDVIFRVLVVDLVGKSVLILDSSYSGSKFNFQKMALVVILELALFSRGRVSQLFYKRSIELKSIAEVC